MVSTAVKKVAMMAVSWAGWTDFLMVGKMVETVWQMAD
jgi:hypothetical protein